MLNACPRHEFDGVYASALASHDELGSEMLRQRAGLDGDEIDVNFSYIRGDFFTAHQKWWTQVVAYRAELIKCAKEVLPLHIQIADLCLVIVQYLPHPN